MRNVRISIGVVLTWISVYGTDARLYKLAIPVPATQFDSKRIGF